MNYKQLFKISIIVFLLFPLTTAQEKYTYEKSEELTPLIDWRDYSPSAFKESSDQNKPIFLLLTAPSWCYWCQVYESEDYLFNPQVVNIINNKFIPIYVDADKRQDLTRQYLEGGWPSTTVMTPGKERIYGYSGVRPVANMIENLNNAANYVKTHKSDYKVSYNYEKKVPIQLTNNQLENLIDSYFLYSLRIYDPVYGGFGSGQKFPQGRTLDLILERYEETNEQELLELVKNTLRNQYTNINEIKNNYNLYDPIEGGFHRYGTRRDWTPPHYEKMLYDNARLLKAYFHLLQIDSDNELAQEVVEKTDSFIKINWYDSENGGFYGNSDVHGEDSYYGKNPRPINKPRIEKTKYTDWNSDAILTYLYLFEKTRNEEYKEMAEKSLNFFQNEMLDENGAYHYKKIGGEKAVQGNLLGNSYLMLAFIEGYDVLGKKDYLESSKKIADYSLNNLYDWNYGGFFERNSKNIELYAPGENINLRKPDAENGIIAYAFLKLYQQTNNSIYLNAGIKTIASEIMNTGGLDNGYYYIKSSQLIINNNLLEEHSKLKEEIEVIELANQKNFWLNELNLNPVNSDFVLSEKGLDKPQGSLILLILIALLAGFISFASPCTLPILPAYIAYTFESSGKNIKAMTLSFFLGLSIIFVLLGMTATLIGNLVRSYLTIFSQVAGIIIILLGIYILLGRGFSGLKSRYKPTSYLGSFLFGGIFGLSWTPCVGPILVAILFLASTSSSVFTGGLLLFSYAIGLSFPLILLSTYLDKANKDKIIWKIIKGKEVIIEYAENKEFKIHSSSLISGLLFIILGYLIFSGTLFAFNQYFAQTNFQKWIFEIEEKLLTIVKQKTKL